MSEVDFKTKYLKYKKKYLDLKSQIDGGSGSIFSKNKVFYAGLLQKNSPFEEIRGTFRNGFFKDTNDLALAELKMIALFNSYTFMTAQNKLSIQLYEEDMQVHFAPYTIYPILLDPLPRLAFDEINFNFDKDNSPLYVRNLENEQELYDAFNQKDRDGVFYLPERKVEKIKVLMVSNVKGWPKLFDGPYALKGIKHPCIKITESAEAETWERFGLTLSEKMKNDDLIKEYMKKTGKDPAVEYYEKNKREVQQFYKQGLKRFSTLTEYQFDKWHR